jgi:hypothetical protein
MAPSPPLNSPPPLYGEEVQEEEEGEEEGRP